MSEFIPKAGQRTKILIADDHPLVRYAIRSILSKEADLEILAEASDGEEAVRLATKLAPDIVIMDISMPRLNGLEATRQIKEKCPSIAVLVLTVHDDSEHILGILEAGAAGFLTKTVLGDEVVVAVRAVAAGETALAGPVFKQILRHTLRYAKRTKVLDVSEKLTVRELELLRLAAKGMSNKEIAVELNLSLRTVKSYLVQIFSKLRVGSRTQAVIMGLRAGIISMDDLE